MSARSDRLRAAVAARIARVAFLRRKRNTENLIVILAATVVGNLSAFVDALDRSSPETEVAFLLMRRTSPMPRQRGTILRPWRLSDLRRVARARAIVTAQGPWSLRTWLSAAHRPLFIDLWHGVGFKSRIATAHPAFRAYDAHFVPSRHVALFYERAGAHTVVTGYGRMDALVTGSTAAATIPLLDELFGDGDGPTVLFAPTWGLRPSIPDDVALRALSSIAEASGARVLYRPHSLAAAVDVSGLPRVRRGGHEVISDAADLLAHVDILVTDWSSIATDFLPLGRPIVYVNAPPPAREPGPLTLDDRPGPVVDTAAGLADAVSSALAHPRRHLEHYAAARSATIERAWGSTLDGASSDRYLTALRELESARRGRMVR